MTKGRFDRLAGVVAIGFVAVGCKESDKNAVRPVPSTEVVASAIPSDTAEEAPPAGCKASGTTPVELGKTNGNVFGLVSDSGYLYYTTWQLYSNRGDLGRIRKDGGGTTGLVSLKLEPRALAVDATDVFYSAGIRLMKLPKSGSDPTEIAPSFSSQSIALDAKYVYGVPGDYGPYDRLVRMEKTGGVNFELDVATRPEVKLGPAGYSAIAVDSDGVYVTDSGNHRVLKFPLERGKPKVLAKAQNKAYDLLAVGDRLYFTLADKGHLMSIPKAGGTAKKLVGGLVPKSRIAMDTTSIIATFAPKSDGAGTEIAAVPFDGGDPKSIVTVPSTHAVEALAADDACVYWSARATGSGAITFYAIAK